MRAPGSPAMPQNHRHRRHHHFHHQQQAPDPVRRLGYRKRSLFERARESPHRRRRSLRAHVVLLYRGTAPWLS